MGVTINCRGQQNSHTKGWLFCFALYHLIALYSMKMCNVFSYAMKPFIMRAVLSVQAPSITCDLTQMC